MMVRRLIASAWTLVILGLCWTPRVNMPTEEERPPFLNIPHLDKIIHFGIFAVFAFLWSRVGRSRGRYIKVAAWGLALTILSELGQLTPIVNRDAGLDDGLADFAGVAIGILFHVILPGKRTDQPPSEGSIPVLSPSDGVGAPTRSSIDK